MKSGLPLADLLKVYSDDVHYACMSLAVPQKIDDYSVLIDCLSKRITIQHWQQQPTMSTKRQILHP